VVGVCVEHARGRRVAGYGACGQRGELLVVAGLVRLYRRSKGGNGDGRGVVEVELNLDSLGF